MGTPRGLDALNAGWVGVVLLLAIGMLAYVNAVSPKKWRLLWQTSLRFRLGRQTMREDLDLQDRALLGLLLVALVLLALFGYQAAVWRAALPEGLPRFLELVGLSIALLVGQLVVIRLVMFLFQGDLGLSEYLYTVVLIQIVLGLLLLPFATLVACQPQWRMVLIPLGVGVVALGLVYRWLRAAVIAIGNGAGVGHILLYICGLEILPIALAVHALR